MSEFIIASVSQIEEKYVCHDKLGKMSVTNRKNKATRYSDPGKAWRVLQTQMPKRRRDGWKVIMYESEEEKKPKKKQGFRADLEVLTSEENFDWDNVRRNISKSFSDIIAYKERLQERLRKINDELCDCEHACEFFKCDAAQGYKLYRMIRDRRVIRRFLKDELKKTNAVLDMSYTEIANGEIENKFKEIGEQTYKPRVLQELFNDPSQDG